MAKTLRMLTNGQVPDCIDCLDNLRMTILKWRTLEKIKRKGSPAVFVVCVGSELIEGWQDGAEADEWQGSGWLYLLECYPDLFPYITDTLQALGLQEMRAEFQGLFTLLPELASFQEKSLDDAIDFLKDSNYEAYDVRLQRYSPEERIRMSETFAAILERLERLSEGEWGIEAPEEGWGGLLRYIEQNYDVA